MCRDSGVGVTIQKQVCKDDTISDEQHSKDFYATMFESPTLQFTFRGQGKSCPGDVRPVIALLGTGAIALNEIEQDADVKTVTNLRPSCI